MKRICVMLSTYNGEQYLREQLDSIYGQQGVDFHILVRDDGSSDGTLQILYEYRKKKGRMRVKEGTNLGSKKSFYELCFMAEAAEDVFDYYAFADQDDVWYPDKLSRAVKALDTVDGCSDKLWYGGVRLVDCNLNPISTPPPTAC